jgi:hypothetical protein
LKVLDFPPAKLHPLHGHIPDDFLDPAPISFGRIFHDQPVLIFVLWESYGDACRDDLSGDIAGDGSIGCRYQGSWRKRDRRDPLAMGRNDARHLDDVRVPDACLEESSVKGIQRGIAV